MKKRQVMEFLTTYGWVVLVVLVSIGALAHLTAPVTASGGRESCSFGPPISCSASVATKDGVSMILSNTDSRIMEIQKIEIFSDAIIGECSWEATGHPYPELESRYRGIVYTLTSNSTAGNGNGTFIPKSNKEVRGTGDTPDNNANWGAADNTSLDGCAFNPTILRSQSGATITYNWKGSGLTHTVTGQFDDYFDRDNSFLNHLTFLYGFEDLPFFLVVILLLLKFVCALWGGIVLFVLRRR